MQKDSRQDVYGDETEKYEVGIFQQDEMICKGIEMLFVHSCAIKKASVSSFFHHQFLFPKGEGDSQFKAEKNVGVL